MIKLWNIML